MVFEFKQSYVSWHKWPCHVCSGKAGLERIVPTHNCHIQNCFKDDIDSLSTAGGWFLKLRRGGEGGGTKTEHEEIVCDSASERGGGARLVSHFFL